MKRSKNLTTHIAAILFSTVLVFALGQNAFSGQQGKPQKLCPVLGGEIDKSVYTDYEGKRVYFCCPGCIDTFKKSPEKYMGKMEAEGIALENTPEGMGESMKKGDKGGEAGHSGMKHSGHMHHDMGGMH